MKLFFFRQRLSLMPDAVQEGKPATDPAWYSRLELAGMRELLRSDTETEIPLLEHRLQAVTDAGKVMRPQTWGGFVWDMSQQG